MKSRKEKNKRKKIEHSCRIDFTVAHRSNERSNLSFSSFLSFLGFRLFLSFIHSFSSVLLENYIGKNHTVLSFFFFFFFFARVGDSSEMIFNVDFSCHPDPLTKRRKKDEKGTKEKKKEKEKEKKDKRRR